MARLAPPPKLTVAQWAERFRFLSSETSALPGRFRLSHTPYLRGILDAITDRAVRKVVCQKSAQIGWSDGVINNFVGYVMHVDPAPMGIMFPRGDSARDYNVEKLEPMIASTPVLNALMPLTSRSKENTQRRKKFPGGFLKMFGSNSTAGVKSTPLKYAAVEEPDDCNINIKGQGDSIKLVTERLKTFAGNKLLVGGTPTLTDLCSIADEMAESDQRRFLVPCHDCDQAHALTWDNVKWVENHDAAPHPIYGFADPESARYACPHCGSLWTDAQKNRNVLRAEAVGFGWKATAAFHGVVGFYLNELYSAFPDSVLAELVRKYLAAQYEFDRGDDAALVAFTNSTLGKTYSYQTDIPGADTLRERAEDYPECTVPWGGLVLTAGVDVQHDRLALSIWAWGRGEECWLVYWGEIHGQTVVPLKGAWVDLEAWLFVRGYQHASGVQLRIRRVTVDTGDGTATQDAAYSFARKHMKHGVLAGKGASDRGSDRSEIFSAPRRALDVDRKQKAWKYGLRPYIVGSSRAKDLIVDGRLKLTGDGPGRIHIYKTVRPDFFDQLTSEIKAPHRSRRGRLVWQKKSGQANEGLDTTIYALHAARALKLNLMRESGWVTLERSIQQGRLSLDGEPEADPVDARMEEAMDTQADTQPDTQADAQPDAPPEAVEAVEAAVAPQPPLRVRRTRPARFRTRYGARRW